MITEIIEDNRIVYEITSFEDLNELSSEDNDRCDDWNELQITGSYINKDFYLYFKTDVGKILKYKNPLNYKTIINES